MIVTTFLHNYCHYLWCLLIALIFYLNYRSKNVNKSKDPPSIGLQLPIVGHMHLLIKHALRPWQGFDSFRKKLGDIVYMRLGDNDFVLISSVKYIKEVLISKGELFANRPHFERYKSLFGGDQENALALCDWSELQRQRRCMAQASIMPRYGTKLFEILDKCINEEIHFLNVMLSNQGHLIRLKKLDILVSTFNIFSNYLCSQRFQYEDEEIRKHIRNYDAIFYDINQCYPYDFMPWLCKFGLIKRRLKELEHICMSVRNFIEFDIVMPRHNELKNDLHKTKLESLEKCKDFLEFNLLTHYADPVNYDWESSLYQMGDLIGGNSAVGNLLYRLLGHLALNPQCQQRIYEEAVQALKHLNENNNENEHTIRLKHKKLMIYTEACIMETLRLASSPIVPHVAIQNSSIGDYTIHKNTYVMFNTFHLNMSEEYHFEPKNFEPIRFLVPISDQISNHQGDSDRKPFIRSYRPIEFLKYKVQKPDHFLPFSWGKRSCLGYKMVQTITFSIVANLMLNYSIRPVETKYGDLENERYEWMIASN